MDIYLDHHDGRELCLMLKTTEKYKNIPVILYSAGDIARASIRDSRADAFLEKPFDINKLFSLIDCYVKEM